MLPPPARTMSPGSTGSPMQSAANAQAAQADTQSKLNNAVTGGKRRRRGGAAQPVSAISALYKSHMVNGTTEQQVGTLHVGEQMGVQGAKDPVPLAKGGKKMRKSRKGRKSKKSKKSRKSRKSRKGRK